MPGQDGVGLDKRRDLFQGLLAELLAKLSEGSTIAIAQLHATSDLLAEETILCGYVGNRSSSSTDALIDTSNCFQCMPVFTSAVTFHIDEEYGP